MLSLDVPAFPSLDALRMEVDSYEPDRLLVRYWPEAAGFEGGGEDRPAPNLLPELRVLHLPAGTTVPQAIASLRTDPRVLEASPDYVLSLQASPNDPGFTSGALWGLRNSSLPEADIDAESAWNVTTGSADSIVAVIDTGIDVTHPDLAANIWTNPGEIAGNGIDDDGNGYVDDSHGWNFVANSPNVADDHGHGTHVAGTIGAVGNNGIGVVGVNWTVKLMALKFLNASGSGSTSDAIRALDYAVAMGAQVSNNSYGGSGFETFFSLAIDRAREAGHIFVAAAGNSGVNVDTNPSYPAAYAQDNVISVAATDRLDQLASWSNYGLQRVDLAAPGVSILSTLPGNRYGNLSGTSMASPHVAGAAAMLWGLHPDWSYQQVIAKLLATVDPVSSVAGKVATGGRLDLGRAITSETDGPRVESAALESKPGDPVGVIRLTFSEPILPSSLSSQDVSSLVGPSGPVAVADVSVVAGSGDREVEIRFGSVEAGSYTLVVGPAILDPAGNFMDQDGDGLGMQPNDAFSATFLASSQDSSATLLDGGFEVPEAGPNGSSGSYLYRPAGSAWSFAGTAGVTANGTAFTAGNPNAPEGDQVAFLQKTGSVSQTLSIPANAAGSYRLRFRAAQRGNYQAGAHDFAVLLDGVELARVQPAGTSYEARSLALTLPAGAHTLSFVGINSSGGASTSFIDDIVLDRVSSKPPLSATVPVYYLVAEEGTYTSEADGVAMEAHKIIATEADHGGANASFVGRRVDYEQQYRAPVVVGQVMTANDPRPSMFWSRGASRVEAPTTTDLYVGMHVGEDPTQVRSDETLGYFVFESGAHHLGGIDVIAGRTGPTVRGLDDSPGFIAPLSGLSSASAAVVSGATMNGLDGSWAVLSGSDPVRPDSLQLAALEDRWADRERSVAGEAVSYVVLGQASGVSAFGGRPAVPGLTEITPRITITRTEGFEPLIVQVSAALTTTDAGDAYTDLEYSWDFGDPFGREELVNPVTGALVNANSDQTGPEASYVYRSPGTYTITLTVRGKDDQGRIITASTHSLLRPSLQEVKVVNAAGGTFQLIASVDGGPGMITEPIRYNASTDEIVSALAALPNIGQGNVHTSPHHWIEASGDLLGHRLSLTAQDGGLIGGGSAPPKVLIGDRIAGSSEDSVSVMAWAGGDIYFDSNYDGISHGPPDGSIEAPFTSGAELKSAIQQAGDDRVWIKRGSHFDTGRIWLRNTGSSPIRVASYGDPTLPLPVLYSSNSTLYVSAEEGYSTKDVVFDGLDIRATDVSYYVFAAKNDSGLSSYIANVHILNSTLTTTGNTDNSSASVIINASNFSPGNGKQGEGFVFWNTTFDRPRLVGSLDRDVGLFVQAARSLSVVGGSISGGGNGPDASPLLAQQAYLIVYDTMLFRWLRFEEVPETSLNFAIKFLQTDVTPGQSESHSLIDGVDFAGPSNGPGYNQTRQGTSTPVGTTVIQNSAFHVGPRNNFQAFGSWLDQIANVVIRDSKYWDNGGRVADVTPRSNGSRFGFYRNDVYIPQGDSVTRGLTLRANLGEVEILDNVFFYDEPSGADEEAISVNFTKSDSRVIDRNQYWSSVPKQRIFYDDVSNQYKTLAEWQRLGWDPNSLIADPGWIDPANGDFRRRR
ncbi:S8 family serine peptidase [Tautonia sociabilis]|nr:S8 family serine peptidase [Tautonia sociabilis]